MPERIRVTVEGPEWLEYDPGAKAISLRNPNYKHVPAIRIAADPLSPGTWIVQPSKPSSTILVRPVPLDDARVGLEIKAAAL